MYESGKREIKNNTFSTSRHKSDMKPCLMIGSGFGFFFVFYFTQKVMLLLSVLICNRVSPVKVKSCVSLLVQMRVNAFSKLVTVKANVRTTEII